MRKRQKGGLDLLQSRLCSIYVIFLLTIYVLAVPLQGYTEIADFKYTLFLAGTIGFIVLQVLLPAELMLVSGRKNLYSENQQTNCSLFL